MLKTKRYKIVFVAIIMFSMVAMYGATPMAKAGNLDSAKDTLSDSDLGASVTHTITLNTHADVASGKVITVLFNTDFNLASATGTCPSDSVFASSTNYITCTVGTELSSTTDWTITGEDIENPSDPGYYDVTIKIGDTANPASPDEDLQMMVYILPDVLVTAHVDATLTFAVGTTTPTDTINTENFTSTSSPDALAFGTLDTNKKLMGHTLAVTTNASDGFVVTVEQDTEFRTAAGAIIDAYSTTTKATWPADLDAAVDIDDPTTWGYIGVTSEDDGAGYAEGGFLDGEFQGLYSTEPMVVFSHAGPSDGSTADKGSTKVGYAVEISSLQEAGDYQNTLTYICTPTY